MADELNTAQVDLKMPRLDGFGLLDWWLHCQPSTNRMLIGVVDDPSAVAAPSRPTRASSTIFRDVGQLPK